MEQYMSFGDWCVANKPLAGVNRRHDEFQITGSGVIDGRVCYTAAHYNSMGTFVGLIGPYPAHAFDFGRGATPTECEALLRRVVEAVTPKKPAKALRPEEVRKAKGPKPEVCEAPVAKADKYDNSHNWGFRGRIAQNARDTATKSSEDWDSEQGTAPFGLRDNY